MTENKKGKEKMYDELKDMDYSGSAIYIYCICIVYIPFLCYFRTLRVLYNKIIYVFILAQ